MTVYGLVLFAHVNSTILPIPFKIHDMLGVNNRHLGTFHTDIANSYRMIPLIHSEVGTGIGAPLLVSESGISDKKQVNALRDVGFRGFLIGEKYNAGLLRTSQ